MVLKFKTVGVIYIPGHVPSFKNSKIITKTHRVLPSKSWSSYVKHYGVYWKKKASIFRKITSTLPKPYYVSFFFVRKSRHKFDYHNICAGPLDLMSDNNWIDDDNMDEIVPIGPVNHHNQNYKVNSKKPGTYIYIHKLILC